MKVKVKSCPTLNDHMDCSPPDSSIRGIFQARVLEWGAIAFSKETPGVTGKFGLGIRNEAGQRLIEFCQETPSSNNTREDSIHGHHQMVNTEIRLIIFYTAKMEKFYTVSKNKTGS